MTTPKRGTSLAQIELWAKVFGKVGMQQGDGRMIAAGKDLAKSLQPSEPRQAGSTGKPAKS